MTPGILGIAAGVWAVVAYTEKFWEVRNVTEKQGFEWVQVTMTPPVWQYTDGDAVKAQVVQSGPVWRFEVSDAYPGESRLQGARATLKLAQAAALEEMQ